MTDTTSVATALEARIRAVPGVRQLFPTNAAAGAVIEVARRIAPLADATPTRVRVVDGVVGVTIATAETAAARHVVHDVHAAIAACMAELGLPFVRADVTVARIG